MSHLGLKILYAIINDIPYAAAERVFSPWTDVENVLIAIKRRGLQSTFTVRKVTSGYGVERIFPFYSPVIESIQRLKKGRVRRAKLYYLRDRKGKAARIREIR